MYEPIFTVENLIYLAILAVAFIITFLFTPITRYIAKKTGAIDVPDSDRKFHRAPTPRLGGIAIALGFIITCVCAQLIMEGEVSKPLAVTAVGSVLICGFGILDDIFNLPAYLKLFLQICVSTLAVVWGGAIEYTTLFGHTYFLGGWAIPVTVLWIVLIINSMNLIDGLDGLACGVSFLSAVALLVIAILMGDTTSAVIAAALCGAAIGFLPYNANPAAVFMGDCGSMLFGYVLACLSVFGFFKGAALMSTVAPALVFALPLIDVIAAFCDRVSANKNPFKPDRSHLHYKLVDIGFSPKQSVAIIYIASAVFCGAAIISLYYKMTSLIIAGTMFLFLFLLKHIDKLLPHEVSKASGKTAAVASPYDGQPQTQETAAPAERTEYVPSAQKQMVQPETKARTEQPAEKATPAQPAEKAQAQSAPERSKAAEPVQKPVEKAKADKPVEKKKKFKSGSGRVAAAVVMGEAAKSSRNGNEPEKDEVPKIYAEKVSLSSEDFDEKPPVAAEKTKVAETPVTEEVKTPATEDVQTPVTEEVQTPEAEAAETPAAEDDGLNKKQ